ncbi:late secretory pathway protein avl9 [Chytridiales sp. JEL 0842]|nr:late secretory pathway protein avl9 [Chytridiales sp. JEL 0842]
MASEETPAPYQISQPPQHGQKVMKHILVVGFHHRNGPQIEYAQPALPTVTNADGSSAKLPPAWSFLPFFCLPDGAHASVDQEFIYFHLPPVPEWEGYTSTTFGLACFSQIPAEELLNKSDDVTRSMVQKAVVVLSSEPILGAVRSKLGLVTQSFFEQKDFEKVEILDTLFTSLSNQYLLPVSDSQLNASSSLRDLVYMFKTKTLFLLKLLLLEKRVIFFSQKIERLCSFQYSLLSLIPELLRELHYSGSPNIFNKLQMEGTPSMEVGDAGADTLRAAQKEQLKRFGLPLHLFGKQIDVLTHSDTETFIIGTSNIIVTQNKAVKPDAVINIDTGVMDINDQDLRNALALTGPDRDFMDELVDDVILSRSLEGEDDGSEKFPGSEEDVRERFENYILSLLVSVKFSLTPTDISPEGDDDSDMKPKDVISDFNIKFVRMWMKTENFRVWNDATLPNISNFINPGHLREAPTPLSALQSTISANFHEISESVSKTFAPISSEISKSIAPLQQTSSEVLKEVSKTFEPLRSEISKNLAPVGQEISNTARNVGMELGKQVAPLQENLGKALATAEVAIAGAVRDLSDREGRERIQESASAWFSTATSWFTKQASEFSRALTGDDGHYHEPVPDKSPTSPNVEGLSLSDTHEERNEDEEEEEEALIKEHH